LQFTKRVPVISLFIMLFCTIMIFPESILLKDGQIFSGTLVYIDKSRITLQNNTGTIDFSIDTIEYLIAQMKQANLDKYSVIVIKRKEGPEQKVNLIKMTETALYYKLINESDLRITRLTSLESLKLLHSSTLENKTKNVTVKQDSQINVNSDLNQVIEKLVTKNIKDNNQYELLSSYRDEILSIARLNPVDPAKDDFYEKFWARIYRYININTENLIWNLLETYSEKEKALNLIYNEKIQNVSENSSADNKRNELATELKDKIIELRFDFYKRARKIILTTER
jgi:hypothetical protein